MSLIGYGQLPEMIDDASFSGKKTYMKVYNMLDVLLILTILNFP